MDVILENPFRILGLPITATGRQISKRVDDLSLFCEMGKEKLYPTDFSILSPVTRTPDSIQRAASQLELADSRLFHSSFWFHSHNSIDELVLELLADGNIIKAKELWSKAVGGNVSAKNSHNARNLSLLIMSTSMGQKGLNGRLLIRGSEQFVNSYAWCFPVLEEVMSDPSRKVNASGVLTKFADKVYGVLQRANIDIPSELEKTFIEAFSGADDSVDSYVKNMFVAAPIRNIEKSVEQCVDSRNDGKSMTAAKKLYASVKEKLEKLECILGPQDLHYQLAADKVSAELILCSTAHFNKMFETDDTSLPFDDAEKISKWAKLVAASQAQKDQVENDLAQIASLREDRRVNIISKKITDLLIAMIEKDQARPDKTWIPKALQQFFSQSKALLSQFGHENPAERHELTDFISVITISLVISYSNQSNSYSASVELLEKINGFNMKPETRKRLNTNLVIIKRNLEAQQKPTGGCYIATLAYGSYDDPQVLKLRNFRDEVLSKNIAGRVFIRAYYLVSPHMVKVLKNRTRTHNNIKNILDKLIQRMGL